MATQRYISTSFWDDEWVQSLNFTEKGLYLYLLTNPLTNIAGVYKITERRIVFDTGLPQEEIERIMRKFEKAGKAYRHGEFVVLPTWPSHQNWRKRSKIDRGIQLVLDELDPSFIGFLKEIGYRYPLDAFLSKDRNATFGRTAKNEGGQSPVSSGADDTRELFMRLWRETKDDRGMCIFQPAATIERPRDWERFWQETPPTREQVEAAFKNFADGINSNEIARRFIPATPDRFALKGGITRYQTPAGQGKKSGSAISRTGADDHAEVDF